MNLMIFALVLGGCGTEPPAPPQERQALNPSRAARVEVVVLETSEARLELDLPGEVGGERDANLAAANGGFVERVLVKEGDTVRKGQALAHIDVGLYDAQLESANAQLQQAEADLKRLEAMGDLATPAQLEGAQTAQRMAAAGVAQAKNRLSRSIIRAPFDGVIATVGIEQGEAVGPGTPVVRTVQLDPAVVNLSVSDRDVVSLVPGTPVQVKAASRSEIFEGTVSRVSPAADLRTRAFPAEVEVPNPERQLLPGMIARVKVQRPVLQDAVVIPQDWLVTRRDQRGVFVVSEGSAVWRDVVLGEVIHDRVVVTEGLEPGEVVVINGHRDLVDGDPLIISREGRCCSEGRPVFPQAK